MTVLLNSRIFDTWTVTFCLLGSLLIVGCTTTQKIADDIMGRGHDLKKKIAFVPTMNTSNWGGKDFQTAAMNKMTTFLSHRCEGVKVIDSPKMREEFKKIPRLPGGQIDNLALANLGRIHGLSAVLEQSITDIQCFTDKRGIWGFRDTYMLAKVSFHTRLHEVETAAVLLDEVAQHEVVLSQEAWQDIRTSARYNTETGDRLLGKIIPDIGDKACRRLARLPWKGYITASSDNTYTLSSGNDVGLVAGYVLEVFKMGEPIKGQADQVYLVTGSKIGEIRVTSVHEHQSTATGIFGEDLEKSCCVKLKH